jgi:hypothetical protein
MDQESFKNAYKLIIMKILCNTNSFLRKLNNIAFRQ